MSGVRIPNGAPDVSWLVGQEVKTLASHAGNMGSIPVRVTKILRLGINFSLEGAFYLKVLSFFVRKFVLNLHLIFNSYFY